VEITYKSNVFPLEVRVAKLSSVGNCKWVFGDGEVSTESAITHTYKYPGNYILTGLLNGAVAITQKITVLDNRNLVFGLGGNPYQKSYRYGNSNEQGYGWSEEGDSGNLWPDSKASIIHCFDENEDFQIVIYDSMTGLPFVDNPRQTALGTNILDAWLDKIDGLRNTGYAIRTRVKIPEYKGSHDSYQVKMSDINLFFSPIYKEKQGNTGYNAEGFRDNMSIGIELYKDFILDPQATSENIPMTCELFFDKDITGNSLQLAFETTDSQYRFDKSEVYVETFDKARFPFVTGMSEKAIQETLMHPSTLFVIRGKPRNRINGISFSATISTGADGYKSLITPTTSIVLTSGFVILIAPLNAVPIMRGGTAVELEDIATVGSGATESRICYGAVTAGDLLVSPFLDVRVFSAALSPATIAYYVKDFVGNHGNNVFGRLQ
jgi:hypothetical protein